MIDPTALENQEQTLSNESQQEETIKIRAEINEVETNNNHYKNNTKNK